MSTSENIASIYIEAILDARKLREQIKDLENQKFELNIKVNDKSLTDLNNHFDKKLSHYKQLERYFGNNPLTVLVNDSQLTELNKQLSEIQNIKNIKIGIEADSLSSLNAEIEESLKKAGDNLKNIISAPFKSIGSGFFEGIGNTFGNQIGLGLNKTLKKDLNFNLQDFTNKTTSKVTNSFSTSRNSR